MSHRGAQEGTRGLGPSWVDLHVHTVVSPCAEVEMIPPLIIERARELGLGAIAITDHNTAENAAAVCKAAEGSGVTVFPGMEVQTREEAHIVCLFDTVAQALTWQEVVYDHLPPLPNREEVFGAQFVVDETGDFVRMNERLLLTSCRLSSEEVVARVRTLGGLPIAAHVDRPGYSLLASLGFIPPGLALAAVEITHRTTPDEMAARHPGLTEWPMVISGDAHRLNEMRASTLVTWRNPCVAELDLALRDVDGRRVKLFDAHQSPNQRAFT
jgi:PHP family Zn ribbon phosphoesterase